MRVGSYIFKLHESVRGRIILHLCFWLCYFAGLCYLNSIALEHAFDSRTSAWMNCRNIMTTAMVYYLLVYVIWRHLWVNKKYALSILSIVLLVIGYTIVDYYSEQLAWASCKSCLEMQRIRQPNYYQYLHLSSFGIIASRLASMGILYQLSIYLSFPLVIKIGMEYIRQRTRTLQLRNENIQLEFNFLKSQVNPHFLFNTLNNIYALILQDKKTQSAETVARLANFMRYTLYESSGHISPVTKEIALLKDYIALEKIRLNHTTVNFTYDIDQEFYTLPPLLFIPVVENAFKFCVESKDSDSWVFINLDIKDGLLQFNLSNTYDPTPGLPRQGGIGLQNLQKRLEHYYPGDRHQITTDNAPDTSESSSSGDDPNTDSDPSVYKINIQIQLVR